MYRNYRLVAQVLQGVRAETIRTRKDIVRCLKYLVLAATPLLAAAAQAAGFAQGLVVGMNHSVELQAGVGARAAPPVVAAGGAQETGAARAGTRMSEEGKLNSNGPNALDRDKGLERAKDRMSAQGTAHEKAHARKGLRKSTGG